ncbi:hypothetical protein STIAU_1764, partial [Stigmatella aurantiaca DW4/3-1]
SAEVSTTFFSASTRRCATAGLAFTQDRQKDSSCSATKRHEHASFAV